MTLDLRTEEKTLPHEQATFDLAKRGVAKHRPLGMERADLGTARLAYDLAPLMIASFQAGQWESYTGDSHHPRFAQWRASHSEQPVMYGHGPQLQGVLCAITDWLTADGQRVFEDEDDWVLTLYGTAGEEIPGDYAGVHAPLPILAGVMSWVDRSGRLVTDPQGFGLGVREGEVELTASVRGPRDWDSNQVGTSAFGSVGVTVVRRRSKF